MLSPSLSSAVPPRLLRGSRECAGVLLDADDARARALALSLYEPGARIYAVDQRLLVLFASARRLRADRTPGALVIAHQGALSTVEAPHEPPPPGTLALARLGRVAHAELARPIDPAEWLDISSLPLCPSTTLGAPPPTRAAQSGARTDARAVLGAPASDPRAQQVALAVSELGAVPGSAPPRWLARLVSSLGSALRWLGARLSTSAPAAASATALTKARPSLVSRMLASLEEWLSTRLLRTRIGAALARAHARYLASLLDMLDRGDLDQALRHAIPLSNARGPADAPPSLPLTTPRARDALTIHNSRGAAGRPALGLAPSLFDVLRERYRKLVDRLLELDRPRDAAFVLAELLDDPTGAVLLLERHGELRAAAELAEGRELPPPLVVRQWLVARDVAAAVRVARRHGAFAPALTLLREKDPGLARLLLFAWAELHASAGDYAAAMELLATDAAAGAEGRALAGRFAELAIEGGGRAGASSLARALDLLPARHAELRERARALLSDDADEGQPLRAAFARQLARMAPSLRTQPIARAALRACIRDLAHAGADDASLRTGLARHADDAALAADAPPMPRLPRPTLRSLAAARVVRIEAADRGSVEVHDAVYLAGAPPAGARMLLALGEAGLRLVSSDGRVLARLHVPAHRLVVSDSGSRALALARRGALWAVSRVDLVARRAEPWLDVDLDAFASTFDGERWAVVRRREALLLDALADELCALFRVGGEPFVRVERGPSRVSFVARDVEGREERFRYDERTCRLLERRALEQGTVLARTVEPDLADLSLDAEGALALRRPPMLALALGDAPQGGRLADDPFASATEHLALARVGEAGARVDLWVASVRDARLHLLLDGAASVRVRLTDDRLVACDDLGRAVALDLSSGELRADVRTRA